MSDSPERSLRPAPGPVAYLESRRHSFRAALKGVAHVVRTQPNARIELAAIVVVIAAAGFFRVTAVEWAILVAVMFGVLALEAVNTAVEATIDLVSPDYHPLAGVAKDAAAGALIVAVVGSIAVAAAIFGPRLLALLR